MLQQLTLTLPHSSMVLRERLNVGQSSYVRAAIYKRTLSSGTVFVPVFLRLQSKHTVHIASVSCRFALQLVSQLACRLALLSIITSMMVHVHVY